MKKVLALIIAVVLVMALSVTAVAAPGLFISSPSGNSAPELESATNEDEDCTADVVITPYSERDTLDDATQKEIEEAYKQIVNSDDLSDLCAALEEAAKAAGVDTEDLAVSDLFDMHYINCVTHDDHGAFTITFKSGTLDNFVALMQYIDGEWQMVKGATVDKNRVRLTFTADELSVMAIVVAAETDKPQTGDTFPWIYVVLLAASAAGLAVVGVIALKNKKKV